jgi:predicted Fe-Mo cluster-binding NifX family protein
MKVALAVWDGRVSPLFDVSREAEILTIERGAVAARLRENVEAPSAALKVRRLLVLGVETLICGAISEPLHRDLTARGVEVLGFVAGEVDEVLDAFIAGALPSPALSMAGCCGRQRRFRGGRGGGRGKALGRRAPAKRQS